MDISTAPNLVESSTPVRITAADIPNLLDRERYSRLRVLSLDCFDTILWRKTATPKDVFYDLQQRPTFKSLGVTAYQRMASAGRAYRENFITHNKNQVSIQDIYDQHIHLSPEERQRLTEEELQAEIEACYAFPPFIELVRKAKNRGLKIIIVSDIYYNESQLRTLLSHHLPVDVMDAIDIIFCSVDHGLSKSEGLFENVLMHLSLPANMVLHIGDHPTADVEAPHRLGIQAAHFHQFDDAANTILRLQHSAASLVHLTKLDTDALKTARVSPFRSVFSLKNPLPNTPASMIGYMTFGPMLYAFSEFITEELCALQKLGKRIKPVFLLRDAYLLYKSCEAYAGESVGELGHIRKFVAVAASFRTQADIDYYMSSIQPYYYNFRVICEQLLLPSDISNSLIQAANSSNNPKAAFNRLIHDQDIMALIFKNSAVARENLKKYLVNHLHLEKGDTLVLIDTGYHGVTQAHLTRALGDELSIEILGRYFIGSHEPDRPNAKTLLTSTWCEHGLFEQCCTTKEGAVYGYDDTGKPLFESVKLSNEQYKKVAEIQAEALAFIHDAKLALNVSPKFFSLADLRKAAEAALHRQIFFPTSDEILFFNQFQHDKDMGADNKKTIFHISQANEHLRQTYTPFGIHPYAERAINIELSLSSLMKRAFDLDFKAEEKSYYQESVNVVSLLGDQFEQMTCQALPTKDGYFTFSFNSLANVHIAIVFGQSYKWVEVLHIARSDQPHFNILKNPSEITLKGIKQHQTLLECVTQDAYIMLNAVNANETILTYNITFRPLIRWATPKE